MTTAAATIGTAREDRAVGLWRDALRRMARSPAAIIGASIIGFFVLIAIFAPLAVARYRRVSAR